VAQVNDGDNLQPAQFSQRFIGEGPVIPIRPLMNPIVWRPVAQELHLQIPDQPKVLAPALVEARLLELIDTLAPAVPVGDDRIAVLDSGGKKERMGRWVSSQTGKVVLHVDLRRSMPTRHAGRPMLSKSGKPA
jgi:hypothetical protein